MLFGTGSAKFQRSGSEVILYHSNLRPEWSEQNVNTIESIYDHYTTFQNAGDYSNFWVDINLFKYDTDSMIGGSADKMEELYPTYLFSSVYFWPHSDGNAVSGSNGEPSVFFIKEFKHSYIDSENANRDVLSIHFVSTDYTTLTGSLV